MVLIILVSLLVLGIAFYQIIQGLFSAMIMTILTVLAAAIAFNFYEPLGDLLVGRLGAYAHPAALLALFVIPLFVLRELFDRVIRGNVVMGMFNPCSGERIWIRTTATPFRRPGEERPSQVFSVFEDITGQRQG